jgi:hypothetical protein
MVIFIISLATKRKGTPPQGISLGLQSSPRGLIDALVGSPRPLQMFTSPTLHFSTPLFPLHPLFPLLSFFYFIYTFSFFAQNLM